MKKYSWLLFVILYSCTNEYQDNIYNISISGTSKKHISIGDTIEVYLDWRNSNFTEDISVNIDGVFQKHLGFINKTTFLLEIKPPINDFGYINIVHPNGSKSSYSFYRSHNPRVTGISSLKGKKDDEINISGIDFSSGDSIAVIINAMHCEILALYDSLITIKVPGGCGNGKIRLIYWSGHHCLPDKEVEIALFSYISTNPPNNNIVKSYTRDDIDYLIERDELGRVSKRKVLRGIGTIHDNYYDQFIYGPDGLIDSLKRFYNDKLIYFVIYERNNDQTIIEISKFDETGKFWEKQEHHRLNGKTVQYNAYVGFHNGIRKTFSNQYSYYEDSLQVVRKNMNSDGIVESTWETSYLLDIYNNGFPDIGAPGFIELSEDKVFPYITSELIYSTIVYDEFGRLVSWDGTKSFCEPQITWNVRKYEYE